MSFQGYQGEINPQVGHEIPGAKEVVQMMQLTQVQLAQIVSSAVSQALTQYVQQIANNPPIAAAASAAAVQQVQTPIISMYPYWRGTVQFNHWLTSCKSAEHASR